MYGLISQIGYRCEKSKPQSVPAAIISKKGDTRPAFASLLLRNFQETSRMPDDVPPSDDAPQELAETPAVTPGTLYDERHFIGGMAIDIAEQQHAEENLRDSGESVRRLIDAIPQIGYAFEPRRGRFIRPEF